MIVFPSRPKHPTKVHVWTGISKKGRTGICIFEGIMKELFVSMLEGTLVPFITDVIPEEHRLCKVMTRSTYLDTLPIG